jgi:hypothetical protein
MFDFLSLRGTNRSFVKPICLIDATAFDFSSRELIHWFATLAMIEEKTKTGNSESELPVFMYNIIERFGTYLEPNPSGNFALLSISLARAFFAAKGS